ncbi:MAG: hypothetical protein WC268_05355 [Patescibacteria group bacterium]|jgi:hypothetical protein
MTNEFRKILDLIKRTGDRAIFYDAQEDSSFAILPINEYEKLLFNNVDEIKGLTEEELLDKINRDIARWRADQELEKVGQAEVALTKKLEPTLTVPVEVEIAKAAPVEPVKPAEDIYQFEPID